MPTISPDGSDRAAPFPGPVVNEERMTKIILDVIKDAFSSSSLALWLANNAARAVLAAAPTTERGGARLTPHELEAHTCCLKVCADEHFHQRDVERILADRLASIWPGTRPHAAMMLALGERMDQACAEAYQRGLRDGRADPSQPERRDDEATLLAVRALVEPQWRPIPADLPDGTVDAFRAGRIWMIDRVRAALSAPKPARCTLRADVIAAAAKHACADCVRCATCHREWCPTLTDRCPGEASWWRHPTGRGRDAEYCYKCTVCEGGYFQFHRDDQPACTEVVQPPHVVMADGRSDQ